EDNRVRRARLLACGLQFRNRLLLCLVGRRLFECDTRVRNALHAVRALLHHTATADRYIRIALHLQLRRVPILEKHEVEAPHFIGTVVGAVPRPYAAVVNHVVQAFGGVRGRADWTNHFARRVFTLHAGNGLEVSLGIVAIALVVDVHTQPVHVAALVDLLLADDRDIVLRLTRNDAVVATHAGVVI